jgi:hypothetical protein
MGYDPAEGESKTMVCDRTIDKDGNETISNIREYDPKEFAKAEEDNHKKRNEAFWNYQPPEVKK